MKQIACKRRGRKCAQCELERGKFDEVVDVLRNGGLVVYPTDTLYALGADPFNEEALVRLYNAKKRPENMPLSISLGSPKDIEEYAVLDDRARALTQEHLPGPLTILARKRKGIKPGRLISRGGIIGIRVPDHPFALRLALSFGPVTATSANLHGGQPPKEIATAMNELGGSVDLYMDCGPCRIGRASTVIDMTGDWAEEVRPGPFPKKRFSYG